MLKPTLPFSSVVFLLLVPGLPARCGQPTKPDQQKIGRLIRQLGSEDGKEQEAAALALKRLGGDCPEVAAQSCVQ
jgi:hypothetical protein